MQAIRTKYFGPSNARSSYIQAKCEAGSIRHEYNPALNSEQNHKAACDALLQKLGWDNDYCTDMVGGEFDGAMYWVFDDNRLKAIDDWVQLTRKGTPTGNPWLKAEFCALVECIARSQGQHVTALEFVDARDGV